MAHGDAMLRDYKFSVVVDGMDQLHFSEVSGLGAEVEAIQFRSGMDPDTAGRILPGRVTYRPVTLTRGITTDLELWNWMSSIEAGQPDLRSVTISVLDEQHEPAVSFRLSAAWPSRLELGPLSGLGNDVAVEMLELTYERLRVEAV